MHTGVFDNRLSMKHNLMSEWSILEALADIILHFRPNPVLEFGAGESTKILAAAAENASLDFYSVDMARHKLVKYSQFQTCILGKTDDFMEHYDEYIKKDLGLVLIDANHNHEQARKEFNFLFPKVVFGGVIFIHDTYPPHEEYLSETSCGDVYKLRQELEKRTDEMDVFTWPYTARWMGLTMVIKKEKDRPYWGK